MSKERLGPVVPGISYVFTIEADIEKPRSAGPGPEGERLFVPIVGGRVYGPRLVGRILPGGADWPVLLGPEMARIEAHYTIEADDGALIYVVNKGLRVSKPTVTQRLRQGEQVAPNEFYMRAAPTFDAPDGPHRWLSKRLFVSSLAPRNGTVVLDVYLIE